MEKNKSSASDTRSRILEAALNCFSENGFHGSTTKIIARRAKVNEVTLFRLFGSKTDLFREVLDHVRNIGIDAKRLDGLDLGPVESIQFVIEEMIRILDNHPREYRIMHHAILDEVEGFEDEFLNKDQPKLLDFLENAFSMLKKEKSIDGNADPKILSILLHSLLIGVASGRVLMQNFPIKSIEVETLFESIIQLFTGATLQNA